ncbi:hypothetical protein, partial [Aeromonas caviae]|uniref:hypothetical protein n=1 Tax=Aeromonas caviae TaxID=648 RepID=UPI003754A161
EMVFTDSGITVQLHRNTHSRRVCSRWCIKNLEKRRVMDAVRWKALKLIPNEGRTKHESSVKKTPV